MDVNLIADKLTSGLEPPVSSVCKMLIHRFAETPAHEQRRMSFRLLADFVHCRWDDHVFQAAITALTTVPDHPLVLYFIMHDEREDREIAIELSYFKQSMTEHVFIHPRTGEEVEDFEDRLIPVFRTSPCFHALLER